MKNYKQIRIEELMKAFECTFEEALEIYEYELENDL